MKNINFSTGFATVFSVLTLVLSGQTLAVSPAQDIATLIKLRNHDCGGGAVSNIRESVDGAGNKTITATCPNGKRYKVNVTAAGKVTVTPI